MRKSVPGNEQYLPQVLQDRVNPYLRLIQEGGTEIAVFQVVGLDLVPLSDENAGTFASTECYIVLHIESSQGAKSPRETDTGSGIAIWNWIGSKSEKDKQFCVAAYSPALRDALGATANIQRVEESQEDQEFIDLWKGVYAVTSDPALHTPTSLRKSDDTGIQPLKLYALLGPDTCYLRLVDIDSALVSSCYSYMLCAHDGLYVCCGHDSSSLLCRITWYISSVLASLNKGLPVVVVSKEENFKVILDNISSDKPKADPAACLKPPSNSAASLNDYPEYSHDVYDSCNTDATKLNGWDASTEVLRSLASLDFLPSCSTQMPAQPASDVASSSDITIGADGTCVTSDMQLKRCKDLPSALDAYKRPCELYSLPESLSDIDLGSCLVARLKCIPRSLISSENCYVFDLYSELFLWMGSHLSVAAKSRALGFLALITISKTRPKCVHIYRLSEKSEDRRFALLLSPVDPLACSDFGGRRLEEITQRYLRAAQDLAEYITISVTSGEEKYCMPLVENSPGIPRALEGSLRLVSVFEYSPKKRTFVAPESYKPGHFFSQCAYLLVLAREKEEPASQSGKNQDDYSLECSNIITSVYNTVVDQYSIPFWSKPCEKAYVDSSGCSRHEHTGLLRHNIEVGSSSLARWKSPEDADYIIYAWFGNGSKLAAYTQARINVIPCLYGIIDTLYDNPPALLIHFEAHGLNQWDNLFFKRVVYYSTSKNNSLAENTSNGVKDSYYIISTSRGTTAAMEIQYAITETLSFRIREGDFLLVAKGHKCTLVYDHKLHPPGSYEAIIEAVHDISCSFSSCGHSDSQYPHSKIVMADLGQNTEDGSADSDQSKSGASWVFRINMLKITSVVKNPLCWAHVRLDSHSSFIVISKNTRKLWLWIGKEISECSENFSRRVLEIAQSKIQTGAPEIAVCTENNEPEEFRSLFSSWTELSPDIKYILSIA